MIPLIRGTQRKSTETERRMVVPRAGEKRKLSFNGDRVSVWEEEEVLDRDGGDGCTIG